jgi:hypothetical protein
VRCLHLWAPVLCTFCYGTSFNIIPSARIFLMVVPVQFSDEEAETFQFCTRNAGRSTTLRTQRDALCPRSHLPSSHIKTAYGGSSWHLLYRFRYLLALKVAVHMWQRCANDVTLQNALGLRAGHFAGNDVSVTGERATEVVVGWPICRKLLLLIVGSVCWRSHYLMCSLCHMLITLCTAKDI